MRYSIRGNVVKKAGVMALLLLPLLQASVYTLINASVSSSLQATSMSTGTYTMTVYMFITRTLYLGNTTITQKLMTGNVAVVQVVTYNQRQIVITLTSTPLTSTFEGETLINGVDSPVSASVRATLTALISGPEYHAVQMSTSTAYLFAYATGRNISTTFSWTIPVPIVTSTIQLPTYIPPGYTITVIPYPVTLGSIIATVKFVDALITSAIAGDSSLVIVRVSGIPAPALLSLIALALNRMRERRRA